MSQEKVHGKGKNRSIIKISDRGFYTTTNDFLNQEDIKKQLKELSNSSISKSIRRKRKSELETSI